MVIGLLPLALRQYQPTLGNIQRALGAVTAWFSLGVQLDVPTEYMRRFEQAHRGDVERCKLDMLEYWMHHSEDVSWQGLASALSDVGEYGWIVRSLMKKDEELRKEEGLRSALKQIGSGGPTCGVVFACVC